MNVPVIRMDEAKATMAWEVHRALLLAERDDQALRDNPLWQAFRAEAYAEFHRAFIGQP